jgi:hypothetical protein
MKITSFYFRPVYEFQDFLDKYTVKWPEEVLPLKQNYKLIEKKIYYVVSSNVLMSIIFYLRDGCINKVL